MYVYTTGINVDQMYDYSSAIISSGIKEVWFEFNAGWDENFQGVIDFLEGSGVSVKHNKEE